MARATHFRMGAHRGTWPKQPGFPKCWAAVLLPRYRCLQECYNARSRASQAGATAGYIPEVEPTTPAVAHPESLPFRRRGRVGLGRHSRPSARCSSSPRASSWRCLGGADDQVNSSTAVAISRMTVRVAAQPSSGRTTPCACPKLRPGRRLPCRVLQLRLGDITARRVTTPALCWVVTSTCSLLARHVRASAGCSRQAHVASTKAVEDLVPGRDIP